MWESIKKCFKEKLDLEYVMIFGFYVLIFAAFYKDIWPNINPF